MMDREGWIGNVPRFDVVAVRGDRLICVHRKHKSGKRETGYYRHGGPKRRDPKVERVWVALDRLDPVEAGR